MLGKLRYCTRNSKHASAINEGVSPRGKIVAIPYCNVKSWFAIAPAEIRTGRILREKADSKQSSNIEDVARKADSSWRSAHVIGIFTAPLE